MGPDPEVVGALSDPRCNEHCKCSPNLPPAPPAPSAMPVAATCTGNVNANAVGPLSKVLNQDWCTSELVTTFCEGGKPVVYGIDQYNVCLTNCHC